MNTVTKYDARVLLNHVVATRGVVYLEGDDQDNFTKTDYWTEAEIQTVQNVIQAYENSKWSQPDVLKVMRLDSRAPLPKRSTDLDAGYDVCSVENVKIDPGQSELIGTGLALQTPPGTYAAVHPRSGLAAKHRVTILNAPGTIDEGYRGEVMVNLINHGGLPLHIRVGDRIAQLVIQKYETPEVHEVSELSETDRGEAGHGSTGI